MSCPRQFREGSFQSSMADLSLDRDIFNSLADPSWRSPSPENLVYQALGTMLMEQSGKNLGKLSNQWFNTLLVRGALVRNQSTNACGIILEVFTCGALLWNMTIKNPSGKFITIMDRQAAQQPWRFVSVLTLVEWKIVGVAARPTAWVAQHTPDLLGTESLVLEVRGKPSSLIEFSASRMFPEMTVVHLSKLCECMGVKKVQKSEVGLLTDLMLRIYPTMSDSDIKARIEHRKRLKQPLENDGPKILLTEDAWDLVSGAIDEEERDQVKGELAKTVKASNEKAKASEFLSRKPAQPTKPASSAPSSGVRPPAAPAEQAPRAPSRPPEGRIPVKTEFTAAEVQHLKPKVPKCTLAVDRSRFMRWVGFYPRAEPPRSQSRVWTLPGWSERRSLMAAVAWLWQCHKEATGESCPFDLEEFDHLVR